MKTPKTKASKNAAPHNTSVRLSGNFAWILGGIFAVAFVLRFVFVCQWFTTPYGQAPYLDAHMVDVWAREILHGHWMRDRAFYQSPLFPYVLALLYGIFGHSLWAVALFNAILGAAACALLALAAGRCFGTGAAILNGLLAAFYRPFLFYTAPILKETLVIFLLSLFLVSFLKALDKNRNKDFVWSGIWLGLVVLARGNIALLGIMAVLLALIRWGQKAFKGCGLFVLAAVLIILPVTVHNAWVSHDFVPVTYAAGFNFYIGNRDGADGGNAYPAEVATGGGEEQSTTKKAETAAGHPLKPSEVSAYWMDRGLDFIALHPHQAAMLWLRKAALFFSNTEIPDNYNLDFFIRNLGTILAWPLPGFGLVLGLAVFGVMASGREKRRERWVLLALACTYMLSVLPFYVTDRYRLPVVVFLLPLAGTVVPALRALAQARQWVRLAVLEAVAFACIIASVVFPPSTITTETIGWTGLSDIEFSLGRDNEGLDYLQKAIAMSPRDVAASFYMNGVFAEDRRGDHDAALRLLDAGIAVHPTEAASMQESYGRFLIDRNNGAAALAAFREALRLSPDFVQAFAGMARAWIKLGNRVHALEAARRGLALDPGNPELSRLIENLTGGGR